MKRILWGQPYDGFRDTSITPEEIILPRQKAEKLKKIKRAMKTAEEQIETIKIQNPLVTQTIEVMNQTEMLQTLIDTYANKSGYNNYLLNPSQVIPQIDFPPENAANLLNDDKFCNPFWFIPPIETNFSKGAPERFPEITQDIAKAAIRKAIAGILRIAGFNEAANSSLVLLTDAVEEFIRNLLTESKHIQIIESKDKLCSLDVITLEKGYYSLTHNSLTCLHNYFKNEIIAKNRLEINEFKDAYNEYDKLMKESQSMQKEEDYMNFLDFSTIQNNPQQTTEGGGVNIMNLLENDNNTNTGNNFKDIFEGEPMESTSTPDDQGNFTGGPPSLE